MRAHHLSLLAILLGYLTVATLFAVYTPDWQAPDEPAHYNYVRQLANGRFPIMENSDYDQAYQSRVISERFDPRFSVVPFSYEDYQPPLYYLLLTPLFWLSGGLLEVLRFGSILLTLATLLTAYAIAQRILAERWQALTAVAFIAFLPQHIAITASVNNDALSELLIALLLWGSVELVLSRGEERPLITNPWLLGILLGCAFLTKVTAYLMAPVLGLALLQRYWREWAAFWRAGLRIALPSALLGSLWWGRNLAVYGWPDFLGIEAHDAVVIGQPLTRDWIAQYGLFDVLSRFLQTTFRSFWGQFGWMGVLLDSRLYTLLALFSGLLFLGYLLYLFTQPRPTTVAAPSRPLWVSWLGPTTPLLLTLFLLNLALYLTYNLTYVQHQGRYLFASLIPIGIWVALSVDGLLRWLMNRWQAARFLIPTGLAMGLAGLALYALRFAIVPQLAG